MDVLQLDDDGAALEEALRFIDEFALGPSPAKAGAAPRPRRKPRVRDPAADVRRRLRRKQERLALRQEAAELEQRLAASRRSSRCRSGRRREDARRAVAEERRRRQAAEALNVWLRAALASHSRLVLGAATGAFGLHLGLADTTQRLWLEAVSAWDASLADSPASAEAGFKRDLVVGEYFESRAAGPLDRSVADVAALVVLRISQKKRPLGVSMHAAPLGTVLATDTAVDVPIVGAPVRCRGVGALLIAPATDALVIAFSLVLLHPSGRLCFRLGGWLQVRPASAGGCAYQSCSRLASDWIGPAGDTDADRERSMAMDALSSKVGAKHERLQRALGEDPDKPCGTSAASAGVAE